MEITEEEKHRLEKLALFVKLQTNDAFVRFVKQEYTGRQWIPYRGDRPWRYTMLIGPSPGRYYGTKITRCFVSLDNLEAFVMGKQESVTKPPR